MVKSIAIVGLGLIGGSIALALKKKGYEIVGCDNDATTLDYALNNSVIDKASELRDLKGSEVVFVCVPLAKTRETIEKVYEVVGDSAIITDVASVKSVVKDLPGRIVGGHPMAGTEHSGIHAAKNHLFENAYYVITTDTGEEKDQKVIENLAVEMKANPVKMTVDEHDRRASKVSHLPHAIAYALAKYALSEDGFTGTGFMDTTRIASSSPDFWTIVAMQNGENLGRDLDEYINLLCSLRDFIGKGESEKIKEFMTDGANKRKALTYKRLYLSEYSFDIDIRDEVGTLLASVEKLTNAGINISGIQIINSREGVGGALRVSVKAESDYAKAIKLFNLEDKR